MKLKDLGDYFIGLTYKPESVTNEGTIVLRSGNIQRGKFDLSGIVRVNTNIRDKLFVKPGDILMCSRNGSAKLVGKSTVIPEIDEPMTFGAFMTVFRTPYNDYLKFFFQSDSFRKQLQSSKTTTINQITINMLDSIDLELPEKSIREERSKILNRIQKIIDKREEEIGALDDLIKARFVEMFGTYPLNEKGWPTGTIRDLVTEVRYGSSRKAAEGGSGKYPYLRMNNITYSGELDLLDTKTIDIPEEELDKCTVRRGDLLFNRTNSKELVGKTCVYNRDELMVLAGFVVRVRLNGKALPDFVSAFMNASFSKQMLLGMCKAAIGQANINAQELQSIGIYIPPIAMQREFVSFKAQIDKSKSAIQKSLDETKTLFDSLMQKYFG